MSKLFKIITGIFLCLSSQALMVGASASSSAAVIENEKQKIAATSAEIDYFGVIKELSKDWQVDWKMASAKEILDKTNCPNTSDYIIELFTGQKNSSEKLNIFQVIYLMTFDQNLNIFSISAVLSRNIPLPPLLSNLFDPNIKEHSIFGLCWYIPGVDKKFHHAVIEKGYDNDGTVWWRIYNSWNNEFTLPEWLGETPFHNKKPGKAQHYQQFGKGRKLSREEIITFCGYIAAVLFEQHERISSYQSIQKFTVNPQQCHPAIRVYVQQHQSTSAQTEAERLALQHAQQIKTMATTVKKAFAVAGTGLFCYSVYRKKPLAAIASAATAVAGWLGATRIAGWWAKK